MSHELDAFMLLHCDKCGGCCRTFEKFKVTKRELKQIAKHLDVTWQNLIKQLSTRLIGDHCYIHQPCTFLTGNTCSIYDVRPWNCRGFPLYPIAENNALLLKELPFKCAVIAALKVLIENK